MTVEDDDEALMGRIGKGDQKAFSLLVARHITRVVGTGWRLCGSKADGEDIAQEAFARVWVNAAKWRPVSEGGGAKFTTWLYRIVINLCIDRNRRPKTNPIEEIPEPLDESDSALRKIERNEITAEVAQVVAELPERQRSALVLCFYEGVSNQEAAKILSLSVGAIESLLVRARRTLREKLAHLQPQMTEA